MNSNGIGQRGTHFDQRAARNTTNEESLRAASVKHVGPQSNRRAGLDHGSQVQSKTLEFPCLMVEHRAPMAWPVDAFRGGGRLAVGHPEHVALVTDERVSAATQSSWPSRWPHVHLS